MLRGWALVDGAASRLDLGRTAVRWLARNRFAVTIVVVLAAVSVYRIVALRSHLAVGLDAGNYLATMQQLFGTDVSGEGLQRPPLIGVMLWPLVHIFGPLEATKLLAVAASTLIGVPFYLLCSRFTSKAVALTVSLPFIFSLRYMNAVSWGFLTLFGVGLFTLCFYLIHEILTAPSFHAGKVLALGLTSWALIAANQMSAVVYVVTTLTFGALVLIVGGSFRRRVLWLLPAALLAVILSLPLIPIYFHQSSAVGSGLYLSVVDSLDSLTNTWDGLYWFYFSNNPLLWTMVALVAFAGVAVLIRRRPAESTLPVTLFLAPFALSMLVVGATADRAAHFLYVPVWLGFAVSADALVRAAPSRQEAVAAGRILALTTLAVLAALTIWRGHSMLLESAEWYGYIREEHVTAIEVADREAPPGAGVAYPRGLGRWAEGIAGRRVYEADQRGLYTQATRQDETLVADAFLAGDQVATNGAAFISDAYVAGDVPMDPAVGIDNGELKHLLYLDDRLVEIEYGAEPALRSVTLADAPFQESTAALEGGAFVDRRTYELPNLQVVKVVTLPEHGESVTVTLKIQSEGGAIARVVIPVLPARQSFPVSMTPQQALFGFKGSTHFSSDWRAGAYVDLSSDEGKAATLTMPPGETTAVAEVKPESSQAEVTLTFTFKGEPSGDAAGLRVFSADELIRSHGITFALVDRDPGKPWFGDPPDMTTLAWLERAPYFRPLWDGGSVTAYLVALSRPEETFGNP